MLLFKPTFLYAALILSAHGCSQHQFPYGICIVLNVGLLTPALAFSYVHILSARHLVIMVDEGETNKKFNASCKPQGGNGKLSIKLNGYNILRKH